MTPHFPLTKRETENVQRQLGLGFLPCKDDKLDQKPNGEQMGILNLQCITKTATSEFPKKSTLNCKQY